MKYRLIDRQINWKKYAHTHTQTDTHTHSLIYARTHSYRHTCALHTLLTDILVRHYISLSMKTISFRYIRQINYIHTHTRAHALTHTHTHTRTYWHTETHTLHSILVVALLFTRLSFLRSITHSLTHSPTYTVKCPTPNSSISPSRTIFRRLLSGDTF